jgi:hypothetical protein
MDDDILNIDTSHDVLAGGLARYASHATRSRLTNASFHTDRTFTALKVDTSSESHVPRDSCP